MKLFEDLPSTDTPINAENLNQIQDNLVVVSATEPTGDNREKVWMQKGKNLLSGLIEGCEFADTNSGIINSNSDWFVTNFIPVSGGETYCVSGFSTYNKWWYDENKNFIGCTQDNPSIAPTNAKYLRMNGRISSSSNMIVVQGDTVSSYEPYIEPKIYIKNDNGVYEEFYKGNKEVVLFQGSELGDINLADSTYNYKYIEVFFSSVSGENDSVKVLSDSTVINCNSVLLDNGIADDNGYIFIAKQLINMGTTLTIKATGRLFKYQKSSEIIQDTLNQLYINKVIGYKE